MRHGTCLGAGKRTARHRHKRPRQTVTNPNSPIDVSASAGKTTSAAHALTRSLAVAGSASLIMLPALAYAIAAPLVGATPTSLAPPSTTDLLLTWGSAGWPALAGLGLAAVAAGAASARRPRHGGERAHAKRSREAEPFTGSAFAEPAPPQPAEHPKQADDPAQAAQEADQDPAVVGARHAYLAGDQMDLAIGVLREHLEDSARPMPVAFLMLLDIYRTHGREDAFRELADRFHARFNAQAPQWDRYPPQPSQPGLEAFPRLVKEISHCWGTHECRRLLDRLLHDNRNGRRAGFTLNAYNDLLDLRRLSEQALNTIEADCAEETTLRDAFAAAREAAINAALATWRDDDDTSREAAPAALQAGDDAMATELSAQLEHDLRKAKVDRSALEIEHPALTGMLAREWGNSALAARLCAILNRGGGGPPRLSSEAAEEIELLALISKARNERQPMRTTPAGHHQKPGGVTTGGSPIQRSVETQ